MLGYTLTEMQWWTGVGGNQAPTCSISLPVDGTTYAFGQQVVFTGAASDPEDGTLMGNSILWSSNIDGNLGNGSPGDPSLYYATTGLSAGLHTIRLTATDSQGATAFATVGITITVANTPPVTTIILPSNATVWNQGSVLTCTATCTDFQQGVITGAANVKWSSSRAGAFGSDNTTSVTTLPVGNQEITCTATDSGGLTGSDTATVRINAYPVLSINTPYNATLFAPSSVVTFGGTANDPEDGFLPNSSVSWTSNLDGQIGSALTFSTTTLTTNTHVVTFAAIDLDSAQTTTTITITVGTTTTGAVQLARSSLVTQTNAPLVTVQPEGILSHLLVDGTTPQ